MIRWIWKQKLRFDKGLSLFPIINFVLLVTTASDKLKIILPLSTRAIIIVAVPCAFCLIWCFGYVLTLPRMQKNEDGALDDLVPMRREIREIKALLEGKNEKT